MTNTPSAPSPQPPVESRLQLYWRLVRLHRPIGILLLLWPTLWALLVAGHGEPPAYTLFAFVLGTVLMRSAGCAINDWADRDFDRHVERTRDRPLTAGRIASWEAVAVFVVLSLVSLLLVLPLNALTWALAVVGAFLAAAIRSPSASSRCPRPIWASPSASASRWRSRPCRTACRPPRG